MCAHTHVRCAMHRPCVTLHRDSSPPERRTAVNNIDQLIGSTKQKGHNRTRASVSGIAARNYIEKGVAYARGRGIDTGAGVERWQHNIDISARTRTHTRARAYVNPTSAWLSLTGHSVRGRYRAHETATPSIGETEEEEDEEEEEEEEREEEIIPIK